MSKISIVIGDDLTSDRLVGEVYLDDEPFFDIFEPPPYQVAIYPSSDGEPWKLSMETLIQAVKKGKRRMDEMQPRRSNDE